MTRLPAISVKELLRKLRRAGFEFDRQAKGSHEIWIHAQNRRRVTIPVHPGNVAKGTLAAIIKEAGLSISEFESL
jgi:predicted RNA binding protein YcfA (HicA-like mRNA interferase family)